ncbi:unnamed protein product [Ectocarpus fasciculatus]
MVREVFLRFVFMWFHHFGVWGPCSATQKARSRFVESFRSEIFWRFFIYASACAIFLVCFLATAATASKQWMEQDFCAPPPPRWQQALRERIEFFLPTISGVGG